MIGFRAVVVYGAVSASALSTGAITAAAADQHGKTAKQCNAELKANAAALEAAGESASAFFHACWWHTAAGQKTPIEAASKPAAAGAKVAKSDAVEPVRTKQSRDESEPVAHSARHAMQARERRVERRLVSARPARRRDEATTPEPADSQPAAVDADVAAPAPVRAPQARAPMVESVPVTVGGVPNAVVLAVPPAMMPLVRDVLNHPAVPGLTAVP